MQTIRVETPSAKYDVVAGSGLVETLARRIERVAGKLPRRVFVVTSAPIWGLWGEAFQASFAEPPIVLFLPPGEEQKTIKSQERRRSARNRLFVLFEIGCNIHSSKELCFVSKPP